MSRIILSDRGSFLGKSGEQFRVTRKDEPGCSSPHARWSRSSSWAQGYPSPPMPSRWQTSLSPVSRILTKSEAILTIAGRGRREIASRI